MEIICEKCNARLNVPEEKIPQGHRAAFSCPKCKHKITLNVANSKENNQIPKVEARVEQESSSPDADFDHIEDDASLDALLAEVRRRNHRLADYKRLGSYAVWSREFPRTASLKVKRAMLRDELAATLDREAALHDL